MLRAFKFPEKKISIEVCGEKNVRTIFQGYALKQSVTVHWDTLVTFCIEKNHAKVGCELCKKPTTEFLAGMEMKKLAFYGF